jgi:ABC-type nitrate/sulfonate/bicarbonate transport system substrate-binding protein
MLKSEMRRVRLEIFPGGGNLPLWIGYELGWFEKAGLKVEFIRTPGSVQQLPNLIRGDTDLALTLIDNVVAYREGQGEVPIVGPDLIGMMTIDTGSLPTLITLPGIKSYDDLRGKTLSLDAMTTGYAFLLLAMLERGGLGQADYKIEGVGGAFQRFEALQKGSHAGALFNSPFEAMLIEKGFTVLDTASSAIGRYQGMMLAARAAWAKDNHADVVAFCRVAVDAIDWLYDRANHDEALRILGLHLKDTPAALEAAYALLTDPRIGLKRKGFVDVDGIANVIAMRSRYGVPARVLTDPNAYYDPSYLTAALAPLK